ncbi:hypothetical protein EV368DRAFT_67242 [Lentinula lateritia]|uniref:Uncharacterized protein n=1 Tax=Lentinula aff. lateritia TaxID=2804960 RepID=A0ACC1TSL2_9AGAR|nr:hypothetical protein F5876DRAFT_67878 [Lentinula aff. lateritia]KAJ3849688.1 hypothetical protein EV368DRAFT_67242 [Lentinula lateritia]
MLQVNFVGVVDISIEIRSFKLPSNLHIFLHRTRTHLNLYGSAVSIVVNNTKFGPCKDIKANQVSATYTEVKLWVIRDKASRKTRKAYIYIGDQGFGLGDVPPLSNSVPPKKKFSIGKPPQDPTELLGPAFFANTQDRDSTLEELRTLNRDYGKNEERYYVYLTEILRHLSWHQTGVLDPFFAFDDNLWQKWNDRVGKIVKKINEKKEKKRKDAQGKSNRN